MQFQPKTEKELSESNLIAPGIYTFEVYDAVPKRSAKGNDMIELHMRVWMNDGTERQMYDYLLPQMAHKLKHFCDATLMEDKYRSGSLTHEDCLFKCGKMEIVIQKGKAREDGQGVYPDRNAVKDYVIAPPPSATRPLAQAQASDFAPDADVPF